MLDAPNRGLRSRRDGARVPGRHDGQQPKRRIHDRVRAAEAMLIGKARLNIFDVMCRLYTATPCSGYQDASRRHARQCEHLRHRSPGWLPVG